VPARTPLLTRVGRRIVRRPTEWLHRPWTNERTVQFLTASIILTVCTVVMMKVVHLNLVFADNTPTGGDMGAHVLGPAELRDNLLGSFQLSGWSDSWYNGFPLYKFYMVPPALLIVLLNVVLPYGVAFKIVTVLGLFALPFCCWAFGRLARFRYPMPELMALASMLFLFDESFSIYGGNVKSTMAGEFSFSISLSLGMLGLGLFARGLETGKHRAKTAIIIALAMLSHGLVYLVWPFLLVIMALIWMDRTRFTYSWTTLIPTALLTMFWFLPFFWNTHFMTDMKYKGRPDGANDSFWDMFFPWTTFLDLLVVTFAIIGFVACVVKRHLNGAFLGIAVIALMAATYAGKNSLPVVGLLWNPRLLPFMYLLRLMLMMVGIVETARFIVSGVRKRELSGRDEWVTGLVTAGVVGVSVLVGQLFLFQEVPGAKLRQHNGDWVYSWGIGDWYPVSLTPTAKDALSDAWPAYNYNGYEGRPYYPEYRRLVLKMDELGDDRGCGRAMWENNGDTGFYGTTMALMLLPHWTDGCITSSEGLFFETSGTTPYHFIAAAAVSQQSSNPVRQLRYTNNDADIGVPMLQKMGIRYLMVFTEAARNEANAHPDLTLVAEEGPWRVYEVANSDVVVPLRVQPVVLNDHASEGDDREQYLEVGTSWFQNPTEWAALPAHNGPAEWQRIDVEVDQTRNEGGDMSDHSRKVDIVVPVDPIEVVELPEITVSNYEMGNGTISFDVSQVGVPVLVKVSYFPNWTVEGADGPYHVAPNFMVVIPRETSVRMEYKAATIDYIAWFLTFVGIGLVVFFRRKGDVQHASPHPFMPVGAPVRAWQGSSMVTEDEWRDWDDDDPGSAPASAAEPAPEPDPTPEPEPEPEPEPAPEPGLAEEPAERDDGGWARPDSV